MGRPSNFKAEYIEQAYKLSLLGLKDTEMCTFWGICEKTLNNWKQKYPDFLQSLKKGKIIADGEVARSLYNRALGSKVKIQQAYKLKSIDYEDGKKVSEKEEIEIVELTQEVPPDTTACIFWLKNRQPEQWRDKVEHSVDNNVTTQDVFLKHLKEL